MSDVNMATYHGDYGGDIDTVREEAERVLALAYSWTPGIREGMNKARRAGLRLGLRSYMGLVSEALSADYEDGFVLGLLFGLTYAAGLGVPEYVAKDIEPKVVASNLAMVKRSHMVRALGEG